MGDFEESPLRATQTARLDTPFPLAYFNVRKAKDADLYAAAVNSAKEHFTIASIQAPFVHTVEECENAANHLALAAKNLRLAALMLKRMERTARKAGRLR